MKTYKYTDLFLLIPKLRKENFISEEELYKEIDNGIIISDLYGTAETGLCILNQSEDFDTIGKPLNNVEIGIMNDNGEKLGINENGQIKLIDFSKVKKEMIDKNLFNINKNMDGLEIDSLSFVNTRYNSPNIKHENNLGKTHHHHLVQTKNPQNKYKMEFMKSLEKERTQKGIDPEIKRAKKKDM